MAVKFKWESCTSEASIKIHVAGRDIVSLVVEEALLKVVQK
jgi:hypothetical protein